MHKVVGVALAIVLVLATGACGGDGDEGAVDESGTTTTTGETGGSTEPAGEGADDDEDCRLLPAAAVQDVFGPEMELRAAGEGCVFREDDGPSLLVGVIVIQIDPEQYAEEALDSCDEGTVVEVEAGDRAYACTSFVGPFASHYEGTDLITLNTSDVEEADEHAVIDQLAELLPSVTAG